MNSRIKDLETQGYRLVGKHSAIKPCHWCKQAIRGKDVCYKKKFYGINSWRCIQASVTMDICTLRCKWCWRDINITNKFEKIDEPKTILDGLLREQKEILMGFYGNENVNKKRLDEAMEPRHVALSLAGETCLYPKLLELIDEINSRGMTSFVVSNGTVPSMLEKLAKTKLTQMYVTLPAPDEATFNKVCKPLKKDGWNNILKSLRLLKKFKRGTVRLTLVKDLNMLSPEKYAEILKKVDCKFLEIKAGMPVGYARYRIWYEQMPNHKEIRDFALKIARLTDWKIVDEKENSKVVLLMKDNFNDRFLK